MIENRGKGHVPAGGIYVLNPSTEYDLRRGRGDGAYELRTLSRWLRTSAQVFLTSLLRGVPRGYLVARVTTDLIVAAVTRVVLRRSMSRRRLVTVGSDERRALQSMVPRNNIIYINTPSYSILTLVYVNKSCVVVVLLNSEHIMSTPRCLWSLCSVRFYTCAL